VMLHITGAITLFLLEKNSLNWNKKQQFTAKRSSKSDGKAPRIGWQYCGRRFLICKIGRRIPAA
ncbi:MAG TPA: hypothetical protein V6D48_00445, partial [Oculatellaceae cyanobacterium]